MDRLLIIDGSNLLFQMFYGMPARIVNDQGKAIQGTLGFAGALLKIIRKVEPTHMVALFDGEHENARTVLDPDYKANRVDYSQVPEEDNPFSQISDVYAALDFMGIKHMETSNCETDDLIAGYALSLGTETEIIISSWDSDFFQLISSRVSVLRYRGEKTVVCTPEYIMEKYETDVSYTDLRSIASTACDMHAKESLRFTPDSMPISNPLREMHRTILKVQIRSVRKRRLRCSMSSGRWRTCWQMQSRLGNRP